VTPRLCWYRVWRTLPLGLGRVSPRIESPLYTFRDVAVTRRRTDSAGGFFGIERMSKEIGVVVLVIVRHRALPGPIFTWQQGPRQVGEISNCCQKCCQTARFRCVSVLEKP
jgi:hypothetical protein